MKIWYGSPAEEPDKLNRESLSLPIGNGYMVRLFRGSTRSSGFSSMKNRCGAGALEEGAGIRQTAMAVCIILDTRLTVRLRYHPTICLPP